MGESNSSFNNNGTTSTRRSSHNSSPTSSSEPLYDDIHHHQDDDDEYYYRTYEEKVKIPPPEDDSPSSSSPPSQASSPSSPPQSSSSSPLLLPVNKDKSRFVSPTRQSTNKRPVYMSSSTPKSTLLPSPNHNNNQSYNYYHYDSTTKTTAAADAKKKNHTSSDSSNDNNDNDSWRASYSPERNGGSKNYSISTGTTYGTTQHERLSIHKEEEDDVEKSTTITKKSKVTSPSWSSWLDRDAVHFGIRMSVCITTACFFVLLRKPEEELHQAVWVVVTVQFVCWFPSLDAASVVEKSIQRLYGTFVGAICGLICGFISLGILNFNTISGAGITSSMTTSLNNDDDDEVTSAVEAAAAATHHPNLNIMAQSLFLIICVASYTFLNCWAACQFKVGGKGPKIITKYNYACILSLLTFYICVLPFYSDHTPKFEKAMYRVFNVILGCFLGAGLSITVLPRSTTKLIKHKMLRQIQLAGEAAQAVLHMSSDKFSDFTVYDVVVETDDMEEDESEYSSISQSPRRRSIRRSIDASRRFWRKQNQQGSSSEEDPLISKDKGATTGGGGNDNVDDILALEKYESAIKDWRSIKTQLGNLRYDPFNVGKPDLILSKFQMEMNNTLARTLRIQNSVLLIDGIVRNDPKHDFSEYHITLFATTGNLIQTMLSAHLPKSETDAAFEELTRNLTQIRKSIIELSSVVASSSQDMPVDSIGKLGIGIITSNMNIAGMAAAAAAAAVSGKDDDDITASPIIGGGGGRFEQSQQPSPPPPPPPPPSILSRTISMESLKTEDDQDGRGLPKFVHGSRVCALLFLQLVEHLTLRCVRLYQSWQECELICSALEERD